ncbi:hypothetical protein T484DRAFT_2836184 [Baffinella frigidus]|nr:hypothetical protein T484DRAFT_2836184 [Cryptophyta sp. CCMP2293]
MSTASGSAWKQLADTKSAIGSSMRSMSRPGIAADDKSETSSAAPSRHGTGATGSVAALSRVRSKQGSGSHAQSLALMQSYVKDADVILDIRGLSKRDKEAAQETVRDAFKKIMGGEREPDLALTNHYAASLLHEEMLLRDVCLQMVASAEFQERLRADLAAVKLEEQVWDNRLYPWECIEDEADDTLGTVRWERNPARENDRRWETGEILGQSLGGEVIDGHMLHLTKDSWVTAAMDKKIPPNSGVHFWSFKKILAGQGGNKAKVGVIVKNTELDQDYNRPFMTNRAFFLDDNGQAWNGPTFVGRGESWYDQGLVVTCRLDTEAREISFYVTKIAATNWQELLQSRAVDPGAPHAISKDRYTGRDMRALGWGTRAATTFR